MNLQKRQTQRVRKNETQPRDPTRDRHPDERNQILSRVPIPDAEIRFSHPILVSVFSGVPRHSHSTERARVVCSKLENLVLIKPDSAASSTRTLIYLLATVTTAATRRKKIKRREETCTRRCAHVESPSPRSPEKE